jgi:hypothetical protein
VNETRISKAIGDYLNSLRIYNLRLNSGRLKAAGGWVYLCPQGTPDRFALVNGHPLFIEVKQPGKSATDAQEETHERIRRAGGIVIPEASSVAQVDVVVRGLR